MKLADLEKKKLQPDVPADGEMSEELQKKLKEYIELAETVSEEE